MVKLSELKDEDMLIVGDAVKSKEDLLEDLEYYKGEEISRAVEYQASIDAKDMLEHAIECEYDNMYEGWYDVMLENISSEDIEEIQKVLNRMLDGQMSYHPSDEVEIDM